MILKKLSTTSKNKKITLIILPIIIYTCISFYFFGPHHLSDFKNKIFTPSGDPESFIWFLSWWPFAITHHLNPFISNYIWFPKGYNLAWSTSIPTLSLIMMPITLLFNATLSFNLLSIMAPALSAISFFYLSFFITKKILPSLFSGYFYGFSSYELGQLLGHTCLNYTFLLPLIILVLLARYSNKIGRLFFICSLSILLVLQFGISIEIFATFIFFLAISVCIFFIFNKDIRHRILVLSKESAYSIIISIILLSPYIYFLIIGFKSVPKFINSPQVFSSDLLNYIIPTPITSLGKTVFYSISTRFTGNFSEEGAYLGVPLFLICFDYFKSYWKTKYTKAFFVIFLLIILFSLGPILQINGYATTIKLPWYYLENIPLLRSALPTRFALYVSFITALIVLLWLNKPGYRYIKYLFVIIALFFILPNQTAYNWQSVKVPRIFQPKISYIAYKKSSSVIIFPFGYNGDSMYLQYVSKFAFIQQGGYVGYIPIYYSNQPLVNSFYSGQTIPNFNNLFYSYCISNKVNKIIYLPETNQNIINELNGLHWQTQTIGSSTIITVPD